MSIYSNEHRAGGEVVGLREALGFTQARAFVRSGSEATRSAVSKGKGLEGEAGPDRNSRACGHEGVKGEGGRKVRK